MIPPQQQQNNERPQDQVIRECLSGYLVKRASGVITWTNIDGLPVLVHKTVNTATLQETEPIKIGFQDGQLESLRRGRGVMKQQLESQITQMQAQLKQFEDEDAEYAQVEIDIQRNRSESKDDLMKKIEAVRGTEAAAVSEK